MRVYVELFGQPSDPSVLLHILWHDAGEIATGDVPFPVKSQNPKIKAAFDDLETAALGAMGVDAWYQIEAVEIKKIKLCDLIEMWEFGVQDYMMGNKLAAPIIDRTHEAALKLADMLGHAYRVVVVGHFKNFERRLEWPQGT
jgi:5'-deoxynucleotidase YfbR-like HD superfamily hydrolase